MKYAQWIIAILMVASGIALLSMFRTNGAVVEGIREVDLGVVEFPGTEHVVKHSFALINTSGRILFVERIASSCGCLAANCKLGEWPEGEEREIDVQMTLRDYGKRSAQASLICRDIEPLAVVLRANGCPAAVLEIADGDARLDDSGTCVIKVRLLTMEFGDESAGPPAPDVTTDPHVDSLFSGWTNELAPQPEAGVAGRFVGDVTVHAPSQESVRVQIRAGSSTVYRTLFKR